jgi:hypothetical protein
MYERSADGQGEMEMRYNLGERLGEETNKSYVYGGCMKERVEKVINKVLSFVVNKR